MPDMDKVINDLLEVREYIARKGHDLSSRKCRMMDKVTDALELLKEQETVKPITVGNDYRQWRCPKCRDRLRYRLDKFCPHCGRAVK